MEEDKSTADATTQPQENPAAPSSEPKDEAEPTETKRKMTKAEKKALYSGQQFEEPMRTWRTLFKELKAPNEKRAFTEEEKKEADEIATDALHQIYGEAENPYKTTLDLFAAFPDGKDTYRKVTEFIMNTFIAWLEKRNDLDLQKKWLTEEVKMLAVSRITDKGSSNIGRIKELFELNDLNIEEMIIAKINELCSPGKYAFREALELAAEFRVIDRFPIHTFIIPNVLQDRNSLVEGHIKGHRGLCLDYIAFFDSFVGASESMVERMLEPYTKEKIMTTQMTRFLGKTAEKNARGACTKLGFDIAMAANAERMRIQNTIRYYICDRDATSGKITMKDFDKITQACAGDLERQVYAVEQCFIKGEEDEAFMWMHYFKVPPYRLHTRMRRMYEAEPETRAREAKMMIASLEAREDEEQCFVGDTPIVWVDSLAAVDRMLTEIEQDPDMLIGIDSEFKPLTMSAKQEVALLQISTFSKAYLVDFVFLQGSLTANQMTEFLKRLFTGKHYKLGFDMQSDIGALTATVPSCSTALNTERTHVICLKRLVNELLDEREDLIDLSASSSEKERARKQAELGGATAALANVEGALRSFKLSDLCEVVLRTTLDKNQQQSNWVMRPLRKEQKVYAARDASILLQLYSELRELAEGACINFDDVIDRIDNELEEKGRREKMKKKKAKMTDEEYADLVEAVNRDVLNRSPSLHDREPTFLTDSMFAGLGKHLRRVGVNVLYASSKEELVMLAKRHSDRIILSFGKNLTMLNQQFPSRVFAVPSQYPPREQVRLVLVTFKIQLKPSNIFRRCMVCNCDQFVVAPAVVIQAMHENASRMGDFEDEIFDADEWMEKIRKCKPEDAGGIRCEVAENGDYTVRCENGVVNIAMNVVKIDAVEDVVEVQILKVIKEVVDSDRPFYYICGLCGKVYWDGTHGKRYGEFAQGLIEATQHLGIECKTEEGEASTSATDDRSLESVQ